MKTSALPSNAAARNAVNVACSFGASESSARVPTKPPLKTPGPAIPIISSAAVVSASEPSPRAPMHSAAKPAQLSDVAHAMHARAPRRSANSPQSTATASTVKKAIELTSDSRTSCDVQHLVSERSAHWPGSISSTQRSSR